MYIIYIRHVIKKKEQRIENNQTKETAKENNNFSKQPNNKQKQKVINKSIHSVAQRCIR